MNTVPKLVFSFPLDWVASFIWLIYWELPACQAMPLALGAEERTRHRPCLHGPSRSCGRMPWSMSKSHRSWRPEPAPPPTWPYYYLTLMTLMVAFISLDATCGGKSWEDNHLESHSRMFSSASLTWSFWQRYATFESKLISITSWWESSFT